MSKDIEKLKFVLQQIDDIDSFVAQFGSVVKTLESKMGWNAANMSIMQIGETLKNKLSDEIKLKYVDYLPIKESYWTRNFIAHDYENVDMSIIEAIIREHLPKLKTDIEMILSELETSEGGER